MLHLPMLPRLSLPVYTNMLAMQVRHAGGHNKWDNIRQDIQSFKRNNLFSVKIIEAVKKNGGNTNPETNTVLKKVLDEASVQHVLKGPIDKALKTSKSSTEDIYELTHEVTGPAREEVLVECVVKNKDVLFRSVNTVVKKCGYSNERGGVVENFDKKGIIVTNMKKDSTFDDAETDAIELGAEEVNLIDEETKALEFITGPSDLVTVHNELTKAGYKCRDASVSYIPHYQMVLNEKDMKRYTKLVDSLLQVDCVVAVHSNVESDTA